MASSPSPYPSNTLHCKNAVQLFLLKNINSWMLLFNPNIHMTMEQLLKLLSKMSDIIIDPYYHTHIRNVASPTFLEWVKAKMAQGGITHETTIKDSKWLHLELRNLHESLVYFDNKWDVSSYKVVDYRSAGTTQGTRLNIEGSYLEDAEWHPVCCCLLQVIIRHYKKIFNDNALMMLSPVSSLANTIASHICYVIYKYEEMTTIGKLKKAKQQVLYEWMTNLIVSNRCYIINKYGGYNTDKSYCATQPVLKSIKHAVHARFKETQ